jgi:raffinose/stachyose/melibiose transport system permease protein
MGRSGKGLVRTIVYFPVIISPLIMGYIWYLSSNTMAAFKRHPLGVGKSPSIGLARGDGLSG